MALQRFAVLNAIECSFEDAYNELPLTLEIKTDFFRICQEALTNIMYHAEATKVIVRIEEKEDKLILYIIDDGKGFIVGEQQTSFGIISMRERAASINGELHIESELGEGRWLLCVLRNRVNFQIRLHRDHILREPCFFISSNSRLIFIIHIQLQFIQSLLFRPFF